MSLSFSIGSTTNRSWGAGPASDIGHLLTQQMADFGSALSEIEIHLVHVGSVTTTNETMEKYGIVPARLSQFSPLYAQESAKFARARKQLKVEWPSRRVNPDEVFKFLGPDLTIDLFDRCFSEVFDALDWALAVTLKPKDAFDPYAFMAWLHVQKDRRFASDEDLRTDLATHRKAASRALDAIDPWAERESDRSRILARALELLDEPRDWSREDDFSPHGNDTGNDIWLSWSEYRRCSPERASAALGVRVPIGPDDDEQIWSHWVQVHLALAFGHIKTKGTCPEPLRALTLGVIATEKRRAATLADWKHREDWLDRLTRYERILSGLT